jgi:Na+-driven multidrug efflux pump
MLGGIRFPITWVTATPFGEVNIWVSFAVSNVAGAPIAYAWYRRGTWREGGLTESVVVLDETPTGGADDD